MHLRTLCFLHHYFPYHVSLMKILRFKGYVSFPYFTLDYVFFYLPRCYVVMIVFVFFCLRDCLLHFLFLLSCWHESVEE
jgi:hypothetical protein